MNLKKGLYLIGRDEFNYYDLKLNKLDFINYLLIKVGRDNGYDGFVYYLDLDLFELEFNDYGLRKDGLRKCKNWWFR